MVTDLLCPPNEERDRNLAGMEAYSSSNGGDGGGSRAITNDDPRSEYTYGEFPLDSFDILVDRALDFVDAGEGEDDGDAITMVDLGSGCGRICFYAALSRGRERESAASWDVHGVEIGTKLHSLAVKSLQRGIDEGLWCQSTEDIDEDEEGDNASSGSSCQISFHNGNALPVQDPYFTRTTGSQEQQQRTDVEIQSLLSRTDLIFAYSTVWETDSLNPFNPDLQAMVLSSKWSSTLAESCKSGCVAVTTDRALNPDDGWRLLDRIDVDNPSVWGSVGYISVLEK